MLQGSPTVNLAAAIMAAVDGWSNDKAPDRLQKHIVACTCAHREERQHTSLSFSLLQLTSPIICTDKLDINHESPGHGACVVKSTRIRSLPVYMHVVEQIEPICLIWLCKQTPGTRSTAAMCMNWNTFCLQDQSHGHSFDGDAAWSFSVFLRNHVTQALCKFLEIKCN